MFEEIVEPGRGAGNLDKIPRDQEVGFRGPAAIPTQIDGYVLCDAVVK